MNARIRLEHSIVLDGRYHAFTSPDLQGFYVTSETYAGAQREAIAVLDAIAIEFGVDKPVVEFAEQAVA